MTIIMIRYGELGLKSRKVRRRFERLLIDDIESRLIACGISHISEIERGRIFVDVDDPEIAKSVLLRVPGIQSFSPVYPCSSDWDKMMESLKEVGKRRIKPGMTYGLKVRRAVDKSYSSHDVAVEGGSAVVSHLKEGEAKVDLSDPDIWIEVEIRGSLAYIYTERIPGIGGMPFSSQGKALIYLPPLSRKGSISRRIEDRIALSYLLSERRGTRVIPCTEAGSENVWKDILQVRGIRLKDKPFILAGKELRDSLIDACSRLSIRVVIFHNDASSISDVPVLHDNGRPIACLFPTAAMDDIDLEEWSKRMIPDLSS